MKCKRLRARSAAVWLSLMAGFVFFFTACQEARDSVKKHDDLYVSLGSSNKIAKIDLESESVVDSIPAGTNPHGLAVSADGRLLYNVQMRRMKDNRVLVTDVASKERVAEIPIGEIAHHLTLSRDGRYLYVAADQFLIIDTRTRQVVARLDTGTPLSISLGLGGNYIYVTNWTGKSISVVSSATHEIVDNIPTGGGPLHSAISPDGRTLYVTDMINGKVVIVDLQEKARVDSVKIGQDAYDLDVDPDGRVFVSDRRDGLVDVIEPSSRKVESRISIPSPSGVKVGPHGRRVFVGSRADKAVYVLDSRAGQVLKRIRMNGEPQHFVFSP